MQFWNLRITFFLSFSRAESKFTATWSRGKVIFWKHAEIHPIPRTSELLPRWVLCWGQFQCGQPSCSLTGLSVQTQPLDSTLKPCFGTKHKHIFSHAQLTPLGDVVLLLCLTGSDPGVFCKRMNTHEHGNSQTSWNYDRDCDLRDYPVFFPELPLMGFHVALVEVHFTNQWCGNSSLSFLILQTFFSFYTYFSLSFCF